MFTAQAYPSPVPCSLSVHSIRALCGWLSHPIHTRGPQEGESIFKGFKTNDLESVATLPELRGFPWFSVKMVTAYPFRTICSKAGIALGFSLRFSVCRECAGCWVQGCSRAGCGPVQHTPARNILLG